MEKQPKIEVGPLITTIEIPDGSATIGKVYQRSWFRPFYFSNNQSPDLGGEIYRYTQTYQGEKYIHTIQASPIKGSPYPFFETKFDENRPERLIAAGDVRFDGDIKLKEVDDKRTADANGIVPAPGESNDTGLSIDDVSNGTIGTSPGDGGQSTDPTYGSGSPASPKFDPNKPISDRGGSSYDNERAASEGGTNPFYNKDGFITLPSWFQWLTWPLAILADAVFSGFGLTSAGKNLLLLIVLGLVVFLLVKNGSGSVTKNNDTSSLKAEPSNVQSNNTNSRNDEAIIRAAALGFA